MAVNPRIPENKYRPSNYVGLNFTDTNRFFAENDRQFQQACQAAGVKPTKEAARRWKQKIGKVWQKYQENKLMEQTEQSIAA